jgi:hypothetical protein
MTFTSPTDALVALKNLPAVRGLSASCDDEFLVQLLSDSAAKSTDGLTTYYRIYYVAAKFLQQPANLHQFKKADPGIEFTGMAVPIASLLDLQASEDAANGWIVPFGYQVVDRRSQLVFGSQSIQLKSRF